MALERTGTCFDDALDTLAEMVRYGENKTDDLFLVHAICLMPEALDSQRYSHAWCEFTDTDGVVMCVFQLFQDGARCHFATEREEYYREMRVEETTRYSAFDAFTKNLVTNSYGPWEEKYLALCNPRESVA